MLDKDLLDIFDSVKDDNPLATYAFVKKAPRGLSSAPAQGPVNDGRIVGHPLADLYAEDDLAKRILATLLLFVSDKGGEEETAAIPVLAIDDPPPAKPKTQPLAPVPLPLTPPSTPSVQKPNPPKNSKQTLVGAVFDLFTPDDKDEPMLPFVHCAPNGRSYLHFGHATTDPRLLSDEQYAALCLVYEEEDLRNGLADEKTTPLPAGAWGWRAVSAALYKPDWDQAAHPAVFYLGSNGTMELRVQ